MSLKPYVYPPSPSPQVNVVREYLQYLSDFNFEKLSSLTTDDFTQQTLPVSLGLPLRSKAEDIAFLKELQAQLNGNPLHYTVYDIDDGQKKTWFYAKLDTLNIEVVMFFQFGEGHNKHKIVSVREFVDSKTYLDSAPKPKASSEPST